MVEQARRLHPLKIPFDLWKMIKANFFIAILLFVLNYDTEKMYMKVFQIVFIVYIVAYIIFVIIQWYTYKYEVKDGTVHITKGLLNKEYRTVPLQKVQNIQRHKTLFHKIFNLNSLTLETGMNGDEGSLSFSVISQKEASRLEQEVSEKRELSISEVVKEGAEDDIDKKVEVASEKTLHFTATRQDLLKASFTSLSFLALIPIIASFYSTINDFLHVEEEAEGLIATVLDSWWILSIILIGVVLIAVAFGMVITFVKYGKYEISSDHEQVFIKKGLLNESFFSIRKEKVQAVQMTQSLMKRLLGLAEVKLISAGNTGEEELEINTLYPFLPVNRAYLMIEEILPDYKILQSMESLPKQAFKVRMLRPSYFWIAVTVAILYFIPYFWFLSPILAVFIIILRILDFKNSRYVLNNEFIQFKSGSLETSLFVTKRSKVIQIKVERTKLQRFFGLASIETVNRSKPVHHTKFQDVSVEKADEFYTWYTGRTQEINVE